MQRRRYLSAAATAAALGLAGCGGSGEGNDTGGGGDTEAGGGETEASTETEAATDTETAAATETTADETTAMSDTTMDGTETEGMTNETMMETETEMRTETEMETETTMGMETTMDGGSANASANASASGGTTGTTSISNTELVINEGEYGTDIYMTGLVENTGSEPLRLPEVRVSFYDDQDSILSSTTTTIGFLQPGTRWEIHEPYFDDGEPARGELEVTSAETFQTELGIPDSLSIAEENLQTGEEPALSVRAENTSESPISPVLFCVFYDGDGIALGDAIDSLDELPPGESWQTTLEYLAYSTQDATRISDYDLYGNTI